MGRTARYAAALALAIAFITSSHVRSALAQRPDDDSIILFPKVIADGTGPAVNLGTGTGRPGGTVCVPTSLANGGNQIVDTTNVIGFSTALFAFNSCTINPGIGTGTTPDKQLTVMELGPGAEQVRVGGNANALPDGLLHTCTFTVDGGTISGTYPLTNLPTAQDMNGAVVVTGTPGQIIVTTCTGDCDGNGMVTIGETVRCVNLFLGVPLCNFSNPQLNCPVADASNNGTVSIGEVVQCVNRFLGSCVALPPV